MKSVNIYSILIMLIISLLPQTTFAKGGDDATLKKLEAAYKSASTDKEKITAVTKLARYCQEKNNAKCVTYGEEGIKLATKAKNQTALADLYNIVGNYHYANKNYRKAVTSLESEYAIRKKLQQARPRAATCYNLGFCYSKINNTRKARKHYDEALTLARKLGDKELIDRVTRSLCDLSLAEKNYKAAYEYLNTYLKAENKRFRDENAKLVSINGKQEQLIEQQDSTIQEVTTQKEELETQKEELETQKEELEIQKELLETKNHEQELALAVQGLENLNLQKEQQLHRQYMIFMGVVLLLAFASLFLIFRSYITKRRANKVLQEKNDVISSQNSEIQQQNVTIKKNLAEIEHKNRDITDSITYASKIQKALLRDFETYKSVMSDCFIFYAPKDIVSGDFYWAHKVNNKFIFTVGDCTGHSVPGAFMSMLGIALLNQIVVQQQVSKASMILEQMRAMVKTYLGQTGINEEPKDGMDMALCVWDLDTNVCNFSGAYNPLLLVREKTPYVYNAIKAPVGIHTRELDFADEYFDVKQGDRMYVFSDGYSDQFGEESHDKFKMSRFRQLLVETSDLPMARQRDKIMSTYYNWKGNFIQIDDVCVLGVEI